MSLEKIKKIKIISASDVLVIATVLAILASSMTIVFGDSSQSKISENSVSARKLAMFATLSYVDLDKLGYKMDTDIDKLKFEDNKMVTDSQLKSIETSTKIVIGKDLKIYSVLSKLVPKLTQGINLGDKSSTKNETTYDYLFYNLAKTDEVKDWKITNYTTIDTGKLIKTSNNKARFTAMTFVSSDGKDVVISYRGTDFDCIGDWLQDILYGTKNKSGQERTAEKYAIAVAKKYPNANLYVTGHSLGGYLAQIGGAQLIEKGYGNRIKEIGYFNGMGLNFSSNITNDIESKIANSISDTTVKTLYKTTIKPILEKSEIIKLLKQINAETNIEKIQKAKIKILKDWYNNGGKLVSYHINGDLVSAIGTHCGTSIGFNAYSSCIAHHKKETHIFDNIATKKVSKLLIKTLSKLNIFSTDPSQYVDDYNPDGLLEYVWMTHETDSFFGVLPSSISMNVKLEVPTTAKIKSTGTGTVIVEVRGTELADTKLTKSDFTTSSKLMAEITDVTFKGKSEINDGNGIGYRYVYNIKIKYKLILGNVTITLRKGVFSIGSNSLLEKSPKVSAKTKIKLK